MAVRDGTTYQVQVWGARTWVRANGSGIEGDMPRARIRGVSSLVPAGEKFSKISVLTAKLIRFRARKWNQKDERYQLVGVPLFGPKVNRAIS